jgi:hypothetical protein
MAAQRGYSTRGTCSHDQLTVEGCAQLDLDVYDASVRMTRRLRAIRRPATVTTEHDWEHNASV